MVEVSFPKLGSVLLSVIAFIKLVDKTIIGQGLKWFFGFLGLVPLWDLIVAQYELFAGIVIAIIFLKWTKNVYVLIFIAIMVFLFLKFGLRSIGAV